MSGSLGSIGGGGGTYDLGDQSSAAATGRAGDIFGGANSVVFAKPGDNTIYYIAGAIAAALIYFKYVKGK